MGKKLEVYCDFHGQPCWINGRKIQEILEHWRDTGRWWAGETEKSFYRLICQDGSIREIYCEQVQEEMQWYLYKTYD